MSQMSIRVRDTMAKRQQTGIGDIMTATSVSQGNVHLSFGDSKAELIQERLVEALTQLYELLEEYAPSWYTPKYHAIAETTLNAMTQR